MAARARALALPLIASASSAVDQHPTADSRHGDREVVSSVLVGQLMAPFLCYADPSLASGRVRGQPFRDAVTRANRRRICVTVTQNAPRCLPLRAIFARRGILMSPPGADGDSAVVSFPVIYRPAGRPRSTTPPFS